MMIKRMFCTSRDLTKFQRLKRAFLPNKALFTEEAFYDRIVCTTVGMASIGTVYGGTTPYAYLDDHPMINATHGGFVGGIVGFFGGGFYPWPLLVIASGCIGQMKRRKYLF